MRPLKFFILFSWIVTAIHASAALDCTLAGEDVGITLNSPFTSVPPGGCLPYRVNIRNDRDERGTWQLTTRASGNFGNQSGLVYHTTFDVAAKASAAFDIAVPLTPRSTGGNTMIYVSVAGPGMGNRRGQYISDSFTTRSGIESPFSVIGKGILGSADTSGLEAVFKTKHEQFFGSYVDPSRLPVDWKAYSGIATLMLSDAEWLSLSAPQHDAVCDYVAQGGHLVLFTTADPATRAPELHLPGSTGNPGPYGFGVISLLSAPAMPLDAGTIQTAVNQSHAPSSRTIDDDFAGWTLRKALGAIHVSGTFMMLFVVLFAVVIGPLNLFVFARGKNRLRLFWTTPLISLAASLFLMIGILIIDGIGGRGAQIIASYSLPQMTREAVIQEQVARTALLFSTGWHSDQNYLITPISVRALQEAAPHAGFRMGIARADLADAAETYEQQDGNFSGNWFRSRHVSGQYLQQVRPSRATLTVLNPKALQASGTPPIVLSSYPGELDRVYLLDQNSRYWTCEHLQPGVRTTCVAVEREEFISFWRDTCTDAGGKLHTLLSDAKDRPGCFYAAGRVPDEGRLSTLDEIHWQKPKGIYLGPWVADASQETGP